MAELQEFKDSSGTIVKYDPDMFTIEHDIGYGGNYLHFNDNFVGKVVVPDGLTDTSLMFHDCKLDSAKHDFSEFDTS